MLRPGTGIGKPGPEGRQPRTQAGRSGPGGARYRPRAGFARLRLSVGREARFAGLRAVVL
jgi:hypothetical protein